MFKSFPDVLVSISTAQFEVVCIHKGTPIIANAL